MNPGLLAVRKRIVAANYASVVLGDGPTQFWRMNETSGTGMVDQVNSADNGTYSGGFTLGQPGIPGDAGGYSVAFNGSTGYARYPNTTITGTSFTVECWVYPNSLSASRQGLVNQGQNPTNNAVFLYFTSGTLCTDLANVAGPSGGSLINGWNHCVVVFTNGSAQLYLNGSAVGSSSSMSPSITGTEVNQLAESNNKYYLYGRMCNVAVYNKALTPTQISNHYNTGK